MGPFPARHVGVAPFPVNNRPETGKRRQPSFRTAAGWCFPLALMLRSIAARRERRRFHSQSALRCVSKHEGKTESLVLILRDARTRVRVCETSRHTRSSGRGRASRAAKLTIQTALPVAAARAGWSDPCIFLFFCRFGIFHPRSHNLKHTHLLVPAARFCARGFATLLHSPRIEGWAERRETFGCSAEHPWARHNAARQALARRLASHDAAIYGPK